MEYSQKLDREQCSKDSRLISVMENGEQPILSSVVWKFSAVNKQQKRIILITNKNVYNVTPQSALANLFSKVVSSLRVKRKIPLEMIQSVSVSEIGYEFVLHVPQQYDYRYSCLDFRDKILEVLADSYYKQTNKKLGFFLTDGLNLTEYVTTKIDIKKGLSRIPNEEPIVFQLFSNQYLDGQQIKEYDFGKYTHKQSFQKKTIYKCSFSIDDFEIIKVIGKGSTGTIYLSELRQNKQLYSIKALLKQDVISSDHLQHVKTERKLLEELHHPNLIYLDWAFHNVEMIFFVMPFIQGGDLYNHLKIEKRFKEDRVKFYAAQIALALSYMHEKDIVYRDLKPENILLDKDGYIVIIDYGSANQLQSGQSKNSFVGTPDYLAPEIILAQSHGKMVDWWTLGILIYEMFIGITPFYSENQNQMFESIKEKEPRFPQSLSISIEAKDIISLLLKKDFKDRLGFKKGIEDIKNHPWFTSINFKELLARKVQSPFIPSIKNPYDISNFDISCTEEDPQLQSAKNSDQLLLQKFENDFNYINYDPINKKKVLNEETKQQ